MDDKDLQHLAAIVRDSDDAIIGKTLEGIITSWNGGAERIYGYTAQEAIGRTVAMLVPSDREDELPKILQKIAQGEGTNRYDTLRVTKDGRLVNISLTVSPIRDASGAITGASSIGRDVTKEKEAEDALRESARAYKLLMEQASDAILVSYPDQPLIEVNQRASDMLGYTREELLQLRGEGSVLPADLSAPPLPLDEILEGAIVYAERPVRRKDGTSIVTELSTRRLDDGRVVTIARDITERKLVEQRLSESEARYRAIVEDQTEIIARFLPDGTLTFVNEAACRFWGQKSEELLGHKVMQYLPDEEHERVQKSLASLTHDNPTWVTERSVLLPSGEERWLHTTTRAIFGEQLNIVEFQSIGLDITERKETEQARKETERSLQDIIDGTQAIIYMKDLEGRYLQVNRPFERLVGMSKEQISGKNDYELFPRETADAFRANDARVIETRSALEVEEVLQHQYGLHTCSTNKFLLYDSAGEPYALCGISNDITERMRLEAAVRKSESQLAAAQGLAHVGSWEADLVTGEVIWSDELYRIYGVRPRSHKPSLEAFLTYVHPDDRELARKKIEWANKKAGPFTYEVRVVGPDGSIRVVHTRGRVFADETGKPIRAVGIGQDITERKRAEDALRESEQRYRTLVEQASDAIFTTDQEGNILDSNAKATDLLGYTRQEFLQLTDRDLLSSEHHDQMAREWEETLKVGKTMVVERRMRRKDGTFLHAETSAKMVEDGRFQAIVRDITDRKLAEKAIRESEARYRTLIDTSPDSICLINLEGNILLSNQRTAALHRYQNVHQLAGIPASELVAPQDRERVSAALRELAQTGMAVENLEYIAMKRDGSTFPMELSASLITDASGQPLSIVDVKRDITERKLAEEELQKRESQLTEAQGIAHIGSWEWDIKTGEVIWSEELYSIFGLEPQSQSPSFERYLEYVYPDDRGLVGKEVERTMIEGGSFEYDHRALCADGSVKILSARGKMFMDEVGKPTRIVGTIQDISERKLAEEELRKSEERYDLISRATNDVVWDWDLLSGDLRWNEAFEVQFGYSRDEIETGVESWSLHIHPDDREGIISGVDEVIHSGGHIWAGEYRFQCKNGIYRDVFDRGYVIRNADGEPVRMVGAMLDMTKSRRAEEALRESETLYRSLTDISPDAIVLTDLAGDIQLGNQAAATLHGFATPEELLGRNVFEFIAPEEYASFMEDIKTVLAQGSVRDVEHDMLKREGERFPAEVRAVLLPGQGGQPGSILAVVRDVTARKRAEENLRSEQEFQRAVLENIHDGIVACDAEGVLTLFNRATREFHGLPEEALPAGKWAEHYDLYMADGKTPMAKEDVPLFQALNEQPVQNLEMVIAPKAGVPRTVSVSGQAIFDDQKRKLGAVASLHDLTASRQAEEERTARQVAQAANLAKSEFLSRMSHELRTPLNAILGFGQLLQMDGLAPGQKESVDYILKAGQHLLGLINEVLDIARIEEGKFDISLEPVLIYDVLQESMRLVQPLAAHRHIEMKADLSGLDNCHVMADQQRLQQVLLNLFANAIKYNREGGAVTVSCSKLGDEANDQGVALASAPRLRVAVTDTGSGLSPDEMVRLFTPFERLGAARGDVEGTGLGLALSKHLIEAMGGSIGVESQQPGRGSTFWIELSQAEGQLAEVERRDTGPLAHIQDVEGAKTVLYIEDNLSNLRLIERILRKQPGINLISAMQGQMGLDMTLLHQPDLILLDLHLPDMSGGEVLRRLRQDPSLTSIPIIILSADANLHQIEGLMELGAQAYLTKPLNVKELLKVIEEALGVNAG